MRTVHFLEPLVPSRALTRVKNALACRMPTGTARAWALVRGDIVIVPVIGRRDRIRATVEQLTRQGKHVALIQYVLRSTQKPSTHDWIDIWRKCRVVWSYYDLPALCREDGCRSDFAFYHAPLGVESTVFHPDAVAPKAQEQSRDWLVVTTGRDWLTESVRECVLAAQKVGGRAWHLGADLKQPRLTCAVNIHDRDLADWYTNTRYVSGLRRIEGFELPAAEGLLCGAWPILFDRPHYRRWYDGLGIFLREGTRQEVSEALRKLFRKTPEPTCISQAGRADASARFNWDTIAAGFWERALA